MSSKDGADRKRSLKDSADRKRSFKDGADLKRSLIDGADLKLHTVHLVPGQAQPPMARCKQHVSTV